MDQHQQELRRAATEAFFESLDKLQETLGVEEKSVPIPLQKAAPSQEKSDSEISLASLEQAVADIEQFMQTKEEKN